MESIIMNTMYDDLVMRSVSLPVKHYSRVIYIDLDNVSLRLVKTARAIVSTDPENTLVLFAGLYGYSNNKINELIGDISIHYYGVCLPGEMKFPDAADYILVNLLTRFMVEMQGGITSQNTHHILCSGDQSLAKAFSMFLQFADAGELHILHNEIFPDYSKQSDVVDVRNYDVDPDDLVAFMVKVRKQLSKSKDKLVELSDIGQKVVIPSNWRIKKIKKILALVGVNTVEGKPAHINKDDAMESINNFINKG